MDNSIRKIQITENQYKTLLNERLSSVLYHFTGLYELLEIIQDDAFYLNTSYRGASDDKHSTKKFYMCFTRQVNGRQGYSRGKPVRIEFDGDLLNQRFEGKPIDYWGDTMGKHQFFRDPNYGGGNVINYEQNTTENEDRLFSNEPVIREISKYIKRIDILLSVRTQPNPFKPIDLSNLTIDSFNNIDGVKIANIIYRHLRDRVFIYATERDFNLRNNNTINELIGSEFFSRNSIHKNGRFNTTEDDIFKLLQFINYAEDKNLHNDKIRKDTIADNAKLLKHYKLDRFLPKIMKFYKEYRDREFIAKNISMVDIFNDLRRDDKENYVLVAKMMDDFFKSHGYKNQKDVILKKEEKYMKERYGYDTDNIIEVFAFKPNGQSDRYGNTIIPNPDKTSFWEVFDDDMNYKHYFIEDIYRNVRKYGSKDDTSFYKYLQHLTKNDISVTNMLSILNKLGFDEDFDVIDYIFGGKFTNVKLNYYTYDNQKYLSNSDKEQVKNMIIA